MSIPRRSYPISALGLDRVSLTEQQQQLPLRMTSQPSPPSFLQHRPFLWIAFNNCLTKWIFCPSSSSSFNLWPFGNKFHISKWSYLLASATFLVTLVMTQTALLHSPRLSFLPLWFSHRHHSFHVIIMIIFVFCLCLWCFYGDYVGFVDLIYDFVDFDDMFSYWLCLILLEWRLGVKLAYIWECFNHFFYWGYVLFKGRLYRNFSNISNPSTSHFKLFTLISFLKWRGR